MKLIHSSDAIALALLESLGLQHHMVKDLSLHFQGGQHLRCDVTFFVREGGVGPRLIEEVKRFKLVPADGQAQEPAPVLGG